MRRERTNERTCRNILQWRHDDDDDDDSEKYTNIADSLLLSLFNNFKKSISFVNVITLLSSLSSSLPSSSFTKITQNTEEEDEFLRHHVYSRRRRRRNISDHFSILTR